MVHVEEVRLQLDVTRLSHVLLVRDGRVGEDLDGAVLFDAGQGVDDGGDDLAGGEVLCWVSARRSGCDTA